MTAAASLSRGGPETRCIACGGVGRTLHANVEDRVFASPGSWNVMRCSTPRCDLLWTDPMPDDATLQLAYRDYYTHQPIERRARAATLARVGCYALIGLAREHLALERLKIGRGRGRLLEVGFGSGSRLATFRRLGWQVHGQEVDSVCARQARMAGFSVHEGPLVGLNLAPASFDRIVGSHVFEHVTEPMEFLGECLRLLRPRGLLVLRTPNAAGYGHAVFGRTWRGLEPPRHVYIYGPRSMTRMLRAAGFEEFRVTSSAARCIGMMRASVALQSRRGAVAALSAARHVIGARIHRASDPSCGDELVVEAVRL